MYASVEWNCLMDDATPMRLTATHIEDLVQD